MIEIPTIIKMGTRGSVLARWQTNFVSQLLREAWPKLQIDVEVLTTQGDRVLDTPLPMLGGKGVFTAELEAALHHENIDCAVHSLKDLPTENPIGLRIGAVPPRAAVNDVLVSKNAYTLATLPLNASIGTSSRRRAAQLLHLRPDLKIVDIRGNVDTRIRKALDSDGIYDGIILAAAGIERLGKADVISEILSLTDMLPAPGQGALAVQCREDSVSTRLFSSLNHLPTEIAVIAERSFLAGLGGGCALPIAAYGVVKGDNLYLQGRVTAVDGSKQINVAIEGTADLSEARKLGTELAQIALREGVASLLESIV